MKKNSKCRVILNMWQELLRVDIWLIADSGWLQIASCGLRITNCRLGIAGTHHNANNIK